MKNYDLSKRIQDVHTKGAKRLLLFLYFHLVVEQNLGLCVCWASTVPLSCFITSSITFKGILLMTQYNNSTVNYHTYCGRMILNN